MPRTPPYCFDHHSATIWFLYMKWCIPVGCDAHITQNWNLEYKSDDLWLYAMVIRCEFTHKYIFSTSSASAWHNLRPLLLDIDCRFIKQASHLSLILIKVCGGWEIFYKVFLLTGFASICKEMILEVSLRTAQAILLKSTVRPDVTLSTSAPSA